MATVYYVAPTSTTPCPKEPCYTLSELVELDFHNTPSEILLQFLPGDHWLDTESTTGLVHFSDISSLTLLGASAMPSEFSSAILCGEPVAFVFESIQEVHISNLTIISCGTRNAAAVVISSVNKSQISNCLFEQNQYGALSISESSAILTQNVFKNNAVVGDGLNEHSFTRDNGGALSISMSNVTLILNVFDSNTAASCGGGIYVTLSTIFFTKNNFTSNQASISGGAVYVISSTIFFTKNNFRSNQAAISGGAVYVQLNSRVNFTQNIFLNNSAGDSGGGGVCIECINLLKRFVNPADPETSPSFYELAFDARLTEKVIFSQNHFESNSAFNGGGINVLCSQTLSLIENTFVDNSASSKGGGLFMKVAKAGLRGNKFRRNSAAVSGGGVCAVRSTIKDIKTVTTIDLNNSADDKDMSLYMHNTAGNKGGGIYAEMSNITLMETGEFFNNSVKNSAGAGGGICIENDGNLILSGWQFVANKAELGGGVYVSSSFANIYENMMIINSTAEYGGGIFMIQSILYLTGTVIQSNHATYGGGIYTVESSIIRNSCPIKLIPLSPAELIHSCFHYLKFSPDFVIIKGNSASYGGGIYAFTSSLLFFASTKFTVNKAIDGGALFLNKNSKCIFAHSQHYGNFTVVFMNNSAEERGGAVMVVDNDPLDYCFGSVFSPDSKCFFELWGRKSKYDMQFVNNYASNAGRDIYGGLVDNCKGTVTYLQCIDYCAKLNVTGQELFDTLTHNTDSIDVSSDPLQLCICESGQPRCNISSISKQAYPGETLTVPVIALGQRKSSTIAVIRTQLESQSKISFQNLEDTQQTSTLCTNLRYTILTSFPGAIETIELYAIGPCPRLERSITLHLEILPCPPGFVLSDKKEMCICDELLQEFSIACDIDTQTVLRTRNATFWVGFTSDSDGIIFHSHCSFDYCTSEAVTFGVEDSDLQCNNNRSGLLCGECDENLSLVLGSSRCLQCSDNYLALLVMFPVAGVVLVVFLLLLNLTVSVGTINGLIFYANVIQINSSIFFRTGVTNILTVFIAWINLDLGIESCFYDGMDTYAKVWLQFMFPLYVWVLLGILVVGSHYLSTLAKLLGRNPIAVLATLFLLSYAKILRVIIAALSFTFLKYPGDTQIAVWLYDGNITYLSGKHVPLFLVALLFLFFLFFPYTMLLLFGQWLQSKSNWKIFSWINDYRIKPFLDAYHAPYTAKHRYWTGLMLLVRCFLFLISAVNAFGDPSINLLATVSVAFGILMISTLVNKIYKRWYLTALDSFFTLNFGVFASATLYIRSAEGNQNVATFTSVSITFITFLGILVYHITLQIKDNNLWKRIQTYFIPPFEVTQTDTEKNLALQDARGSIATPVTSPTTTWVDIAELREPCLETSI